MHVCWWVFEGVFEALGLYGAGGADGAGLLDVGDVFVVFGEHVVGLAAAVGFLGPVGLGCVCIGGFGGVVVFC